MSLDSFVVLNESSDFAIPGDVSVFSSREGAIVSVEPIDVRNGEYFALSGAGRRLDIIAYGDDVNFREGSDNSDYSDVLLAWLQHAAQHRKLALPRDARDTIEALLFALQRR